MTSDTRLHDVEHTEEARVTPRRRSRLAMLTALAAAAVGLVFLFILVQAGGLEETDLLFVGTAFLVAAALAATRLRWGALPAALLGLLLTFAAPFFQDFSVFRLTHPQEFGPFVSVLLLHTCGLIAAVGGLGATWESLRGREPRAGLPRWSKVSLILLAGFLIGCTTVGGGIAAGIVVASSASPVGAGAVEARFIAADLLFTTAPDETGAGDIAITLLNEGEVLHNVAFDGVADGAPVVEAPAGRLATGQVRLEPGTYTYFCSVPGHREAGMEGQLTVSG